MDGFIRRYKVEELSGGAIKEVEYIDIYTGQGLTRYKSNDSNAVKVELTEDYLKFIYQYLKNGRAACRESI